MSGVAIIGAGFAGLAAARDLARAGHRVTVYEADAHVGGLAGSFDTGGAPLDRFYHHWFTSDHDIMALVDELGLRDEMTLEPSLTGVWFNGATLRLSTPWDLLRFHALPFADRIRLGLLALRARRVRDWRALESRSAADWLCEMGGERVYRTLWEPLLRGKFGHHADEISAVWIWNKLKLRGGSRGRNGAEQLAYMRGSFARVAQAMAQDITRHGGRILTGTPVRSITPDGDGWRVNDSAAQAVVATVAPPLLAQMIAGWADTRALTRIDYLANLCLVLELDRSLSDTYWLNVTDPDFPFVGVIEHTRFQPAQDYAGRHVVYLSRYLPQSDPLLRLTDAQVMDYALPHIQRMFPAFDPAWVQRHHVWRADWAQPIVTRHYSAAIPPETIAPGLYLASMAQIYPEDRGTNYAVRAGRAIARRVITDSGPGRSG